MNILSGITARSANTVAASMTPRLVVENAGEGKECVMALAGTMVIGKSEAFDANDPTSPAAQLRAAIPALRGNRLKICVGEPKAHWQGLRYIAPRAGQQSEYDAGEWYAEIFGENEEAAVRLLQIAEIGFWAPKSGFDTVLEFQVDPDRQALAGHASVLDRLRDADERAITSRESRSGRRLRGF